MRILVLNCGSSSVKFQVIAAEDESCLAAGLIGRVGEDDAYLRYKPTAGEKMQKTLPIKDHKAAIALAFETLLDPKIGVIGDLSEIGVVGHRVVHGGETFAGTHRLTDEVIRSLEANSHLAPLHNPPNISGINAVKELLPTVPQVGVFDTAFHQTMPKHAYLYAVPMELYEKHGARRYGFHGTSHDYVSRTAADILGKPRKDLKIVTCHLGNGSSMAAICNDRSIDTSMGMTPLEGLVMGTRCGDLDPGIVPFLVEREGWSIDQINHMLNKESGLQAISGISNDCLEIENAAIEGHERCQLALDMFSYRVKKYIGAYAAAMNGIDVLIFTGGIGENSPILRKQICDDMDFLGIEIDEKANDTRGEIHIGKGKVKVMMVPTNEELQIAREAKRTVS